ncbi:MAG TPA: hypothetical protein VFZ61_29100, partial [Polyangiales bacterium]
YCRGEQPTDSVHEPPSGPAPDAMTSGLTVVSAVTAGIESRLAIRDLSTGTGGESRTRVHGAITIGRIELGEHEATLWLAGKQVLKRRFTVAAGTQLVLTYSGTARQPLLTLDQVDVSSPEPGARRAHVSNHIHDGSPLQLFYYDADDQLVAETPPIALGGAWEGTIPAGATSFRLSPDDEQSTALPPNFPLFFLPTPGPCAGAQALGLVVYGRSKQRPGVCGPEFAPAFSIVPYALHPALCGAP